MNIESELKSKSYYIDFYAKMANDHVDALKEYSDKLVCEIKQIQMKMKTLREQNKKLKEALTFYAKGEHLGLEDWQIEQILKDDDVFAESYVETGKRAREALKADKYSD